MNFNLFLPQNEIFLVKSSLFDWLISFITSTPRVFQLEAYKERHNTTKHTTRSWVILSYCFPYGYSLTFPTRPPSTSLSVCAAANSSTCCIIPSGADWQQGSLAAVTLVQLLQFWDEGLVGREGGRDYCDRFALYRPILPLSSPSLHHFIHSICRCHAMSDSTPSPPPPPPPPHMHKHTHTLHIYVRVDPCAHSHICVCFAAYDIRIHEISKC